MGILEQQGGISRKVATAENLLGAPTCRLNEQPRYFRGPLGRGSFQMNALSEIGTPNR